MASLRFVGKPLEEARGADSTALNPLTAPSMNSIDWYGNTCLASAGAIL